MLLSQVMVQGMADRMDMDKVDQVRLGKQVDMVEDQNMVDEGEYTMVDCGSGILELLSEVVVLRKLMKVDCKNQEFLY